MTTPGCTTARRRTGSTERMRLSRVRATSTASPSATRAAREPGAGAARDERHVGEVQQADHLAHLVRRARHDDDAGIRLARRQAVHGVGLELGAPVPHPAGPDDPAERLDQRGDASCGGMLGSAWPLPVGVGAPVHLQRPLGGGGERREREQQRLDPARGRALRQQPLLDREVDVDARPPRGTRARPDRRAARGPPARRRSARGPGRRSG